MSIKEKRPWGEFLQFCLNKKCTVKILTLKPNQELSLQKHKKREELWYFLDDGVLEIDDLKKKVKAGTEIIIKKNQKHRAIATKKTTRILEISFGNFDELDEIRLKDKYGRC
jgi:mannose-6-phosphate isomerase